jgi:hypothetical protein
VSVVAGCGGSAPVAASSAYRYNASAGWSLTYPRSMHLEHSSVPTFVSEVTIASFRAGRGILQWSDRSADGTGNGGIRILPPTDPTGRFPSNGVAFRLIRDEDAPPVPVSLARPSQLPLRLTSFQRSQLSPGFRFNAATGETTTGSGYAAMPRSVERSVTANGSRYIAVAWIGAWATSNMRTLLMKLIASVSFSHRQPLNAFN